MKTKEMKSGKIWLSALAIALLFAFAACSNPTESDSRNNNSNQPGQNVGTDNPGHIVLDRDGWYEIIGKIKDGGDGKDWVITIQDEIEIDSSDWRKSTFGDVEDITVTLKGNGALNLAVKKGYSHLLTIGKAQTLIIDGQNLTLRGLKTNDYYYASIIGVNDGAKLFLKRGTLTGNLSVCGGGVYVYDGGEFTMNGGTIIDNEARLYGAGVKIEDKGKFTMTNGTITENKAKRGGGVFAYGIFEMTGGEISLNSARYGAGVYTDGSKSAFRKSGGTVYGVDSYLGNTAEKHGDAFYQGNLYGTAGYGYFDGNGDWVFDENIVSKGHYTDTTI